MPCIERPSVSIRNPLPEDLLDNFKLTCEVACNGPQKGTVPSFQMCELQGSVILRQEILLDVTKPDSRGVIVNMLL